MPSAKRVKMLGALMLFPSIAGFAAFEFWGITDKNAGLQNLALLFLIPVLGWVILSRIWIRRASRDIR